MSANKFRSVVFGPGQIPDPNRSVRLRLSPALCFGNFDNHDSGLKTLLQQIANKYQVYLNPVETTDGKQTIMIEAPKRENACHAARAVANLLVPRGEGHEADQPNILLDTPTSYCLTFTVDLGQNAGHGVRPSAPSPPAATVADLLATQRAGTPELSLSPVAVDEAYTVKFAQKVQKMIDRLRYVPNQLHMRVQFGALFVEQWRKVAICCSRDELQRHISRAAARGTTRFVDLIGNFGLQKHQWTEAFKSDLFTTSFSEGDEATILELSLPNALLQSDIEVSKGRGGVPDRIHLGPLRAYDREKRYQSSEITTISPERNLDWRLQVLTRADPRELRVTFTNKDLEEQLTIFSSKKEQAGHLPRFALSRSFASKHKVEAVTWSYIRTAKIRDCVYRVNFLTSREWQAARPTVLTDGAGLELFNPAWDSELMDAADIANGPRDWRDDLTDFFPRGERELAHLDGIGLLINWINRIRDLVAYHVPKGSKTEAAGEAVRNAERRSRDAAHQSFEVTPATGPARGTVDLLA